MRYQIKDKHNFCIREDGDSSMVLFKEKHDQFILNGTGLVMFNLILENNQTQKVLEELKKIYENIEIAVLENDLQDIIRMLKMYGILVMEQEIEENVCKHTDISAVDENDYEKVGRFVEENRCSDFFVAGGKGYYTAVNIRAHIMNNQEYYFYKIGENGKIDGLIIVVPNVSNNSVVNITTLVVSKEKNREERIKIAKDLMDYAMKSMINQVNKLRISFYAKEGNEVSFLGMYKKLGFEKEAELKDEYENKSLFLYSMFI